MLPTTYTRDLQSSHTEPIFPDQRLSKHCFGPMPHSRRSRLLHWLRVLLRWPIAPWRCMAALLDRIGRLEAGLASQVKTLTRLQSALDHDSLTTAHSRLYFEAALRQEVARFTREHCQPSGGKGFVVGLIDIDQFKPLNDRRGHAIGDLALIRVVEAAQRILRRQGDVFARYGGDEFVFLLPQTSLESAHELAEKLRASVAALTIANLADPISISIGLAVCPMHGISAVALLQAADGALYRAKTTRNAVRVSGMD